MRGILQHQGVRADAVKRQLLFIDGDSDLFGLFTQHTDIACLMDLTQLMGEAFGVIVHLTIGLVI